MINKKTALFLAVVALVFGAGFVLNGDRGDVAPEEPDINVVSQVVPEGVTFGELAEQAEIGPQNFTAILAAAKEVYDLSNIVSGRELAFVYDEDGGFRGLEYNIDSERKLVVEKVEMPVVNSQDLPAAEEEVVSSWAAQVQNIPYETDYELIEGSIETSLYQTMVEQGADERLAIALSEVFAWQVDFALDIQKGDSFRVFYEKRYLDGQYVMPGRILAAEFINNGNAHKAYYFRGDKTEPGYYTEDGEALQKVFLKSPLQYKYISSGYTVGTRRVAELGLSGPHRGIDYAANYGTPSVSVGDGTVVRAGWDKYLGLSVVVRHNETHQSVYGHFQSLARGVRYGAKVKQGQVIGYVGSTGYSTGPHLHFEMRKYGSHINPLTMEVPPGEPVDPADLEQLNLTVQYLKEASGI